MDPLTVGALGSAGLGLAGDLAGALISSSGSKSTNFSNQMFAWNMWREQLDAANHAHQREVKDLQAAGLNPLLSATKGATTPGAGSANIQNPNAAFADAFRKIKPETLLGLQQMRANIAKTKAEEALLDAQTQNVKDQNTGIEASNVIRGTEAIKAEQDRDIVDSWFGRNIVAPIRVMFGNTGTSVGNISGYTPKTSVHR